MASETVKVPAGENMLVGELEVPRTAPSVVLIGHGGGSSHPTPGRRAIAADLRGAGLGTLRLDLLTDREEREDELTARHRFDVPLLARRTVAAIDWLGERPETRDLPVGLLGVSTDAAAALLAAIDRPERVYTVVALDGRPDLADGALKYVRSPVLFIVGGDEVMQELNRKVAEQLSAPHKFQLAGSAPDLFDEPGTVEAAAAAARAWFLSPVLTSGGVP